MGLFSSPKAFSIPASVSFANRTCLVTGATSGLGFEAAVHYVKLGAAKLYITARTASKGQVAKEAIEARAGKTGVVEVLILDMDDFAGVTHFVDTLKKDVKAMDIIMLNAGLITFSYATSPDGWEKQIQVNVLSTVLLALLKLPWLKTVKQDGVVQHLGMVGSGGHMSINISAPEFPKKDILSFYNEEKNFRGGQAQYNLSKLFLHFAAHEIAKLAVDLNGQPSPIVNTVCPGQIATNLARDFANKSRIHKAFVSLFLWIKANTAENGAKAYIIASTTTPKEHDKFIRPYLTDAEYAEYEKKMITNTEGRVVQAEFWSEIVSILKAAVPEVQNIVHV